MKKNILLSLLIVLFFISCSEDSNIEIKQKKNFIYPDAEALKMETLKILEGRNGEGSFVFLEGNSLAYVYTSFNQGGSHDSSYSDIYYIVSNDSERKIWSEPKLLIKNHGEKNIMSVSCLKEGDKIIVQYLEKNSLTDLKVVSRYSYDNLKSLTPVRYLNIDKGYNVVNNDRILKNNNSILTPISRHTRKESDGSLKFYYKGVIELAVEKDNEVNLVTIDTLPKYIIQEPGIVKLKDNRLMAWGRSNNDYLFVSYSNSNNYKFSTFEENKNIKPIHLSPISIKNIHDDLIVIYNKELKEKSSNRSPLVLAVSKNDLQTIYKEYVIEKEENLSFAYTAIIKDGEDLLLAYYMESRDLTVNRGKMVKLKGFYSK